MKTLLNISTLAFLGLVLMASSYITEGESGKYTVLDTESSVTWEGSKITGGKHNGTLSILESSIYFDGEHLAGGSFTIDMNSIKSTDLSGNSAQKLEGHLKSDDFFGVASYPTASFVISKVDQTKKENQYLVTGDLTIKSTTLPISFPVELDWTGDVAIANAKVTVNRADFDVRYGSGKFFDGLGDKAIKDEFTLDLTIVSGARVN